MAKTCTSILREVGLLGLSDTWTSAHIQYGELLSVVFGVIGHKRLPWGGIICLRETQEQLPGLENITTSSTDKGMSSEF